MGLWDKVRGRKGASRVMATRSFIFPDMDSARRFQGDLSAGIGSGSRRGNAFMGFMSSASVAGKYGGQMFRSVGGREISVYGYQQFIHQSDREYLFARDPTAAMFIEKPWVDMWNGFPQSYIEAVDNYFASMLGLGLLTSLQASYQEHYQEGGGCILLETTGDPETRLSRGERPLAWTFIPASNIIDEDNPDTGYILSETDDALLDHGIEYIWLYPTDSAYQARKPMRVHGSRLIPVNLDPRKQKWWRTPNVPLHRIYDTLWELRDIIFSRTRAHFQGDPVVVDVDLSADAQKALNFHEMDETQKTAMGQMVEQSIVDYNSGAKSTFAPVMGFKMRRLGAAQLPDPKEDVMMLSSRLAHGSVFPVKMVLASTKGSTDVSDQDLLIYQGNLQNVRNTWGYKHLAKALLMGRVMGVNGLRMQDAFALPPPQQLDWPLIRPLTPRDAAFTDKTDVAIYREAQEAGLVPSPRIRRKFAEDSRYPIPLWLAARGRNTLGENTDTDPKSEPGSAGRGSTASAQVQDDVEALVERVVAIEEHLEDEPRTVTKQVEVTT